MCGSEDLVPEIFGDHLRKMVIQDCEDLLHVRIVAVQQMYESLQPEMNALCPARSHKSVLRHASAKHDPNAGQREVLLLCDRTYSRKHNSKIRNRRKT